jgi:polyisoprenoid-binding protein YceI
MFRTGSWLRLIVPVCLVAYAAFPTVTRAQAPVFEITPVESKWTSTLTFTSPELSSGVLEIKIQADSVDTGSGMKNGKLKSKDFFNADQDPYITFKSTKIVQTGPDTFEVDGDFTIRGVTKQEKLSLVVTGAGTGAGTIKGTMAFDRKQYGMNSGIPFIKIADRVEVSVDLTAKRVSGPPVKLK